LHFLCQLSQLSFTVDFSCTGSKFSANFSMVNSCQLSLSSLQLMLCCCNCSSPRALCVIKFTLGFTVSLALLALKFTLSSLNFSLCLPQLASGGTLPVVNSQDRAP
jgi:hypothetical protein